MASQARGLAAHGIESGYDHGFGRVVDDQVHAGGGLQGADVAALAADDAALHIVVGQVDDGNGGLRHVVGRAALDRQGDDVAGFLFALLLGFALDVAHQHGGVMVSVLLDPVDDGLAGFVLSHVLFAHHTLYAEWHRGLDENAQAVGMITEHVETCTSSHDARLVVCDMAEDFGLHLVHVVGSHQMVHVHRGMGHAVYLAHPFSHIDG